MYYKLLISKKFFLFLLFFISSSSVFSQGNNLKLIKNRIYLNLIYKEINYVNLEKVIETFDGEKWPNIKYKDVSLYKHQSDMIKTFKNNAEKSASLQQMVLYQAPTGTGKTMTPIALSRDKKIIFVCAAKHIGLQLAKSCISLEIPIAIAFGCNDPSDIRLHYYAAKDYTKNYKTGAIFRVDNSVGNKVEIIICDIKQGKVDDNTQQVNVSLKKIF